MVSWVVRFCWTFCALFFGMSGIPSFHSWAFCGRRYRSLALVFHFPLTVSRRLVLVTVACFFLNFRAFDIKHTKSKTEVARQANKGGKTVHFANLMDLCHLKNAELAKHHQKYKGRVVLREDNVKDEEGYWAVFTEQGAPASQMAATKFLDTISKLPVMAGAASDAVSAYTQVKMTEAPRLLRLSKDECPEIWIRIHPRQRPNSWDKIGDPVVPLEKHLYGHP